MNLASITLIAIAVLSVLGLVVALVWLPLRVVRGLNAPERDEDNDLTWT